MGKYYKQLYYNINEQLLKEEVLSILEKHPLHLWDKQLCLTHPKNCNDTWYHGSGSAEYITENNKDFKQYDRETLLKETDFTELNNELKAWPYIFELIQNLKKQYQLGRIRIMVSERKHVLTWHRDTEDRLHIPVITHEGCRMVIEEESFHMTTGEIWQVNTNEKYHTAFNGSPLDERIHIVGTLIQ